MDVWVILNCIWNITHTPKRMSDIGFYIKYCSYAVFIYAWPCRYFKADYFNVNWLFKIWLTTVLKNFQHYVSRISIGFFIKKKIFFHYYYCFFFNQSLLMYGKAIHVWTIEEKNSWHNAVRGNELKFIELLFCWIFYFNFNLSS